MGTKLISKVIPAAKADDTVKAVYKNMYTISIRNSVIAPLQNKFEEHKLANETDIDEEIKEYERMYRLYLLALDTDIQAAKKVTNTEGKLLLARAEYALKNYSYERYIELCKRAVRKKKGGGTGLQYQIVGNKIVVSGKDIPKERAVSANVSEMVIPSEIQGKPVYKVGDRAFEGNNEIEVLVVEEGVNIIGKEAFANCTNLKQVYLPDSVTIIKESAFANCLELQDIQVRGKNLKEIGENALLNTGIK